MISFRTILRWLWCDHATVIRERRSNGLRLVCMACHHDLGPATFDEERSELARRLDRQQYAAQRAAKKRARYEALRRQQEEPSKVRRIA